MKKKIRAPIFWFSTFMALMLFQTSYMKLGTMTAFVTMAMTIISAFLSGSISIRHFRFPTCSKMLTVFLGITALSTFAYGEIPGTFVRYVAQILLCIVLLAIPPIDDQEQNYLETVFLFASAIYAVLTIRSCISMGTARYFHSSIILFNTRVDPNFIGIPFVAASTLALNSILERKKILLNIAVYILMVLAIVYTSSRGNMLSLAVTNAMIFLFFLKKKSTPLWVRILFGFITVLFVLYIMNYISVNFIKQWERMTSFSGNADNGRFVLWRRAFDVWKEYPLFGCGFGGMYRDFGKASHNTYFQLLSETGVIGLAIFLLIVCKLLLNILQINKSYFVLLIGCLFQIAFLDALDNRCLWVILCWLSMLPRRKG